jgi:hypothetical protein
MIVRRFLNFRLAAWAGVCICLTIAAGVASSASASQPTTFSAENDTGSPASGLIVYLQGSAQARVTNVTAPGCGTTEVDYLPPADFVDFGPTPAPTPVGGSYYDTIQVSLFGACLAAGSEATLEFDDGCSCVPPSFSAHEWLPRPAIPGQTTVWPHNDTGRFVSRLRVSVLFSCIDFNQGINCGPETRGSMSFASLVRNPAGCADPQVNSVSGSDFEIVWPTACVSPGDFVEARFAGCDFCSVQSISWSVDPVGGSVYLTTGSASSGSLPTDLAMATGVLLVSGGALLLRRRKAMR